MTKSVFRRRRSIGQPPGDVDHHPADTPQGIELFIAILERRGRQVNAKEALCTSLGQTFYDASLSLRNRRSREESNEIRKEIRELDRALRKANGLIAGISEDTFALIRGAAIQAIEFDPRSTRQWTGTKRSEKPSAWKSLEKAEIALSDLTKWSESAVQRAGRPPRGKPVNTTALTLATKLYEIWVQQTGDVPSISEDKTKPEGEPGRWTGDFVDLCSEAMTKIWAKYGKGLHPPDPGYYANLVISDGDE